MEVLWAPWRLEYILGPKPDECVFCLPQTRDEDRERLVLLRARHNFVIMNKFPYNNGHLMVTPYRHVMNLADLTSEESHEMMDLLQDCVRLLKELFTPEGVNVGLNIGEAAGAGIREHLHFHLVPRWNGDSSFMAVFSETRIIPEHLLASYDRMLPHFASIEDNRYRRKPCDSSKS
ncbi:MAG: HIT domain-containing protein [Desulfovibrio sp.]|nr:MAG: HIT domain-containing protein [Desulfovibrio sp.]